MPAIRPDTTKLADVNLLLSFVDGDQTYVLVQLQNIELLSEQQARCALPLLHHCLPHTDDYPDLTSDLVDAIYCLEPIDRTRQRNLVSLAQMVKALGFPIDKKTIDAVEQSHLPPHSAEVYHYSLGEMDKNAIETKIFSSAIGFSLGLQVVQLSELTFHQSPVQQFFSVVLPEYQVFSPQGDMVIDRASWQGLLSLKRLSLIKRSDTDNPSDSASVVSFDSAFNWMHLHEVKTSLSTLFAPESNQLTPDMVHNLAILMGDLDENIAYLSLKPKRLLLHHLLAELTLHTAIVEDADLPMLMLVMTSLYELFNPTFNADIFKFAQQIQKTLRSTLAGDNLTRYLELKHKARVNYPKLIAEQLFYSDLGVEKAANMMLFYQLFQEKLQEYLAESVHQFIEQLIVDGKVKPLAKHSLARQEIVGLTGGVASGKSAAEKAERKRLGEAAFVSSDSWNKLLLLDIPRTKAEPRCGSLSLAEAWWIKNLFWRKFSATCDRAPHVIQEGMQISSIHIPKHTMHVTLYVNTAQPTWAVRRMKTRGIKSGRFVGVSETMSSYRLAWRDLLKSIAYGIGLQESPAVIKVIDTDCYYAGDKRPIATLNAGILSITHLSRFISLINRSYQIKSVIKKSSEPWEYKHLDRKILETQLGKLYETGVTVCYQEQSISAEDLLDLMIELDEKTKLVQQRWRSRVEDSTSGFQLR